MIAPTIQEIEQLTIEEMQHELKEINLEQIDKESPYIKSIYEFSVLVSMLNGSNSSQELVFGSLLTGLNMGIQAGISMMMKQVIEEELEATP